jgi:Fe-Mn family superoxide dismutase
MTFALPKLPYELDALSPNIEKQTLEFHYGKHHKKYVDKTNDLIKGTKFENATLEDIIREADGGIFNNGAQVWNHTFYFYTFAPAGAEEPSGGLADAIKSSFGSFGEFKDKYAAASTSLFGSGWTWLVKKDDGSLDIVQKSNAGNPLRDGLNPLLTCDVWEHAYYLDYQNRRPDYIKAFWNIIDWDVISKRYND